MNENKCEKKAAEKDRKAKMPFAPWRTERPKRTFQITTNSKSFTLRFP